MEHVRQSMMIILKGLTLEVLNLTDLISLTHSPNAKMLVIQMKIVDFMHIATAMSVILNVSFIQNRLK